MTVLLEKLSFEILGQFFKYFFPLLDLYLKFALGRMDKIVGHFSMQFVPNLWVFGHPLQDLKLFLSLVPCLLEQGKDGGHLGDVIGQDQNSVDHHQLSEDGLSVVCWTDVS